MQVVLSAADGRQLQPESSSASGGPGPPSPLKPLWRLRLGIPARGQRDAKGSVKAAPKLSEGGRTGLAWMLSLHVSSQLTPESRRINGAHVTMCK